MPVLGPLSHCRVIQTLGYVLFRTPRCCLQPPIYSPLALSLLFFLLPTLYPSLPTAFIVFSLFSFISRFISFTAISTILNSLFTICLQSYSGRVKSCLYTAIYIQLLLENSLSLETPFGWRLGRVQGRRYEVTTLSHSNIEQQTHWPWRKDGHGPGLVSGPCHFFRPTDHAGPQGLVLVGRTGWAVGWAWDICLVGCL